MYQVQHSEYVKEIQQAHISEHILLTFLKCFLLQQSVKDQAMYRWDFWSCSNCCSAVFSKIISNSMKDKHRVQLYFTAEGNM